MTINEHLFIQKKKVDNEEVEEAVVEIAIHNKGFFKGDLIGNIEISLSKIFNMKNHVMLHQKVGVCNPNSDDFSKLTGILIVSINVQGPGCEATELTMGTPK